MGKDDTYSRIAGVSRFSAAIAMVGALGLLTGCVQQSVTHTGFDLSGNQMEQQGWGVQGGGNSALVSQQPDGQDPNSQSPPVQQPTQKSNNGGWFGWLFGNNSDKQVQNTQTETGPSAVSPSRPNDWDSWGAQ